MLLLRMRFALPNQLPGAHQRKRDQRDRRHQVDAEQQLLNRTRAFGQRDRKRFAQRRGLQVDVVDTLLDLLEVGLAKGAGAAPNVQLRRQFVQLHHQPVGFGPVVNGLFQIADVAEVRGLGKRRWRSQRISPLLKGAGGICH